MQKLKARTAGIVAWPVSIFLVALATLLTAQPAAAAPTTYNVTSTACTGAGSITEAMDKANTNPGEDTISFTPGLVVDFRNCPPNPAPPDPINYFTLQAKESVIFEGNGAKLFGEVIWLDQSGINRAGQDCAKFGNGDRIIAVTPGFITVGVVNKDNADITVTVRELNMEGLSAVAVIQNNASLVMEDLTLKKIYSQPSNACQTPAISAGPGANFSAYRTVWNGIWNDGRALGGIPANGAIGSFGTPGRGNLTIEDSLFVTTGEAGAISWDGQAGSEVNIVSSRFDDAGGIAISGAATSNVVNSIWSDYGLRPGLDDRIVNLSTGEMNIIASTLLFGSVNCDGICEGEASSRGRVLSDINGGAKINLIQSAIGVTDPDQGPVQTKLLDTGLAGDPLPGFSADVYTWIQPTALQDADALKAVTFQPDLLTEPPGLLTFPAFSFNQATRATPLVPGELIDIVTDAVCDDNNQANDGANPLRNPIDGSCITEDALGNPRVDGNNNRNSGAVQLSESPHLSVVGVGDGTVGLIWTKPTDLIGTITGYNLYYGEVGGAFIDPPIMITDPDTLTYQATGLTNGTEYQFLVVSVVDGAQSQFASNLVTATPQGVPELDCTMAVPSSATLWPPNHSMVSIDVLVLAPGDSPVTVSIDSIFQDEPVNGLGDGDTSPDAEGIGTRTASLRAEREGGGNGRVYTVSFTASLNDGEKCEGSVTVGVPHNPKWDAVNDGPLFDSTQP